MTSPQLPGPRASRPYMPGYGILAAGRGSGLMPWAEAERRLTTSRNYWVSTVTAAGHPHLMPVWALWIDAALWFSSALRSRKVRNIVAHPQCTVATDDADNPVIVSGPARIVTGPEQTLAFLDAMNTKYNTAYGPDFLDPAMNATVQV
jgi:nitroimidazol reductase NimA-like FMN-containing flavoprotein (pyridoxamine 5'-phosphate oxidase superfamily)